MTTTRTYNNGRAVRGVHTLAKEGIIRSLDSGYESMVKHLIENGAKVNKDGIEACEEGNEMIMKLSIDKGASINKANKVGHEPTVKLLIEKGAEVCLKGYESIVKRLIETRDEVNKEDKYAENDTTPLINVYGNEKESIVKILIEHETNVNQRDGYGAHVNQPNQHGISPLQWAIHNNQQTIMNLLVKYGAD
ncbi:hypothetical protein PIROE2DRAFT_14980 [Piromyces sp. E2]|nr:hypothetical protein PIROE2DRAFT_14980 [Piromyces sp. E2]|eukprot:OUM59481.1 hypothetical protein PIROE2DRAFT_14980 [Piromyces sp. E2]